MKAWKTDRDGSYIEMIVGERKDYAFDAVDILNGQTIATTELTLDPNITQFGATQIVGTVITFVLVAGAAGVHPCNLKTTGNVSLIDFFEFRVKVTAI
ncbi:MAG: hypothetical protein FVQ79_00675 [Planctomycetes bacterium]|nr:hypothetical protein [Planctomycetota bacterium]